MIYEEIFREFEHSEIKYLVVGGMAVNIYGYARLTMDLDIMVDLSEDNLEKLIAAMERYGYVPRIPVRPQEFLSKEKRDEWIKEKGAVVFTFIDAKSPYKQVDVFLVNLLDFEDAYSRKVEMRIGVLKVNIVSMDDLIRMKTLSGRPRDVEDIHHLKKIKELKGK